MNAVSAYGYFGLFGSGGEGVLRSFKRFSCRPVSSFKSCDYSPAFLSDRVDEALSVFHDRESSLNKAAPAIRSLARQTLHESGALTSSLDKALVSGDPSGLPSGLLRRYMRAWLEAHAAVTKSEKASALFSSR